VGLVLAEKFELLELIGEGAMGWVYRARHLALSSSVAVKLMKPDASERADRAARFEREARAASQLNHPHILSVSDFGETPGGLLYIVSELLRGAPLDLILDRSGPLPLARILRIYSQVLGAVEEAHRNGIIHRDIKPENIIVTTLRSGEDVVKVVDFGIAKVLNRGGQKLTRQGQVFGTPAYMAPEQARGGQISAASDLYSCGILLFTLLVGRPPFWSESVVEIMTSQMNDAPPTLEDVAPQRKCGPELEAVVARALQKAPADRYSSAADLLSDFSLAILAAAEQSVPCPSCGEPLRLEAKFCSSCGSRLREDTLPGRDSGLVFPASNGHQEGAGRPASVQDLRTVTSRSAPIFMSTVERRLYADTSLELQVLGRDRERAVWEDFLQGDQTVLEILGPPGVGRSALLGELARDAAQRDRPVLSVAPDPTLARSPWYPIRQLVARLLGMETLPPERLDIGAAAARADLPQVDVPGLQMLFGHPPIDEALEFAVRERETRAAARQTLLFSNTSGQGLCVFLDDVDEFDGASLAFVRELAEAAKARSTSVKLVLVSSTSVLAEATDRVTITPDPLALQDVIALLEVAFSGRQDVSEDAARTILEQSGGLALQVVQSVRLLLESGDELDQSLPDLLATRIGRLPTPALRLLQILTALGRSASLASIRRLWEGDDECEDALTLLIRRGFVLPDPQERIQISHPSLVSAVQEAMAADARRGLHRRIFERMTRTPTDPVVAARHAFEAQLGERSLDLLEAAADAAQAALDDMGAAIHLRRALRVARWELLLEPDSPRCLHLAFQLSEALRYAEDSLSAEIVLKEVVEFANRVPDTGARIWRSLARLERNGGRHHEAETAIRRAVGLAVRSGDGALLTEMYLELGRVLAEREDWGATAAELEEGTVLVTGGEGWQAEKGPRGFWRLLADSAALYSRQGLHLHAMELARNSLAHAQREPSLLGQARTYYLLGSLFDEAKLRAPAMSHYQQAYRRFCDLGDRRSQGECLLALAAHEPPGPPNAYAADALKLFEQVAWRPGIESVQAAGHVF
jgi:eukaryotic-like serine/threonine-protein kinase